MTIQALDLLSTPLKALAAELGVSLDSLKSYRAMRRAPNPETARALAALMRRRSKALTSLAGQLEREAEREGGAR